MPRIESEVASGKAAKKGSVLNKSNDEPMAAPTGSFLEGHLAVDAAAVGAYPKGVVRRSNRDSGGSPEMPGGQLVGHQPVDPTAVSGAGVAKRSAPTPVSDALRRGSHVLHLPKDGDS